MGCLGWWGQEWAGWGWWNEYLVVNSCTCSVRIREDTGEEQVGNQDIRYERRNTRKDPCRKKRLNWRHVPDLNQTRRHQH